MSDRRENFMQDITSNLINDGMDPSVISSVMNAVTRAMANYDVSEKSTALTT